VTLTLTLDRVILHTVVQHSSTSTYTPNFTETDLFVDGRTDGRTFEIHFLGRLRRVNLKNLFGSHYSPSAVTLEKKASETKLKELKNRPKQFSMITTIRQGKIK